MPAWTFTLDQERVRAFADLVGDHNPVHLDAEFAATTTYKVPICHGMLVASLISGCLVKHFGPGTIYLEQQVSFGRPVPVGSQVRVVFGEPQPADKGALRVDTSVEIQKGTLWKKALTGSALVQPGA